MPILFKPKRSAQGKKIEDRHWSWKTIGGAKVLVEIWSLLSEGGCWSDLFQQRCLFRA